MPRPEEVFTPNSFPTLTYVERQDTHFERRLAEEVRVAGVLISVSGPSKTGKTVLVEGVLGPDRILKTSCGGVASHESLWDRVLDELGAPHSRESSTGVAETKSTQVKAGGTTGIPFVLEGRAEATGGLEHEQVRNEAETHRRKGLPEVLARLKRTGRVLVLDDLHYLDAHVRSQVSRSIRSLLEGGVTIVVCSVPHHREDLFHDNRDLQGRVSSLPIDYWNRQDLASIGWKGLKALGLSADEEIVSELATESRGSPQLMQLVCLSLCFELSITGTSAVPKHLAVERDHLRNALRRAATKMEYLSTATRLLSIKTKSAALELTLQSGATAKIARCLLQCIANDPPAARFALTNLMSRLRTICSGSLPEPGVVEAVCRSMHQALVHPTSSDRPLEWDGSTRVLHVPDPYFLFYLRWSSYAGGS